MHITTLILLIFVLFSIFLALYHRDIFQWNKNNIIEIVFIIITIYTSISIYDQECIITGRYKRWGWIRFGLIMLFIIFPIISILIFGKSYIQPLKKIYTINI